MRQDPTRFGNAQVHPMFCGTEALEFVGAAKYKNLIIASKLIQYSLGGIAQRYDMRSMILGAIRRQSNLFVTNFVPA